MYLNINTYVNVKCLDEDFFFSKESDELNDETLNKAFQRVYDNFDGYDELKEAFCDIRDEIHNFVRSCADNVIVVIYIDEVLREPIKAGVGKEENRLRITIKSGGKVTYSWTKETWSKIFYDAWNKVKSIVQGIISVIVSKASTLFSVTRPDPPAITTGQKD